MLCGSRRRSPGSDRTRRLASRGSRRLTTSPASWRRMAGAPVVERRERIVDVVGEGHLECARPAPQCWPGAVQGTPEQLDIRIDDRDAEEAGPTGDRGRRGEAPEPIAIGDHELLVARQHEERAAEHVDLGLRRSVEDGQSLRHPYRGQRPCGQPDLTRGGEQHVGEDDGSAVGLLGERDPDIAPIGHAKLPVQPQPVREDDFEDVATFGLVARGRLDENRHATLP